MQKLDSIKTWTTTNACLAAITALLVFTGFICFAAESSKVKPRTLQTMNLQQLPELSKIEQEIEAHQQEIISRYGIYETFRTRIRLLTNSTIVIMLEPRRKPSEGDDLNTTFTCVFYDAPSGKYLLTMKWPARSSESDLFPLYDGGFLIRVGDKLIRYSADFQRLRERDLSERSFRDIIRVAEWHVAIAPGGRVALLNYSQYDRVAQHWECSYELIDVDTFQQNLSLTGKQPCDARPATDTLATTLVHVDFSSGFRVDSHRVALNEHAHGWRTLTENAVLHRFISDDQLLISDNQEKTFSVINRRGEALFVGKVYSAPIRSWSSLDGKRLLILDAKGPLPIVQKYYSQRYYLKVFDLGIKRLITEMSLGTHPALTTDAAFSPDGSRIAVLTETTLRIYEIP